jgi:hypothetical protein
MIPVRDLKNTSGTRVRNKETKQIFIKHHFMSAKIQFYLMISAFYFVGINQTG